MVQYILFKNEGILHIKFFFLYIFNHILNWNNFVLDLWLSFITLYQFAGIMLFCIVHVFCWYFMQDAILFKYRKITQCKIYGATLYSPQFNWYGYQLFYRVAELSIFCICQTAVQNTQQAKWEHGASSDSFYWFIHIPYSDFKGKKYNYIHKMKGNIMNMLTYSV